MTLVTLVTVVLLVLVVSGIQPGTRYIRYLESCNMDTVVPKIARVTLVTLQSALHY